MLDINRENYQAVLAALVGVSRSILQACEQVDLPKMRQICGEFEAIAPIIEPTAYMRGGMDNLADQAAFLAAVDRFVTDLRKLDRRPTPEGTT